MNSQNKSITESNSLRIINYALLLVVAIFMFSVLWRDAHSSWAFTNRDGSVTDNYFIALNAKNISLGKGWGLYNGYEFVPFEREISTGPVVFLPVALMAVVIKDLDDARYVGVILPCIILLLVLLMRLKSFFPPETYRVIFLLMPFLLLAFMREQWYLVLGEVATSLLLLISASYAAEEKTDCKKIFLSGLAAGMALMSKLISILCSPWIAIVLLAVLVSRHGWRRGLKNILPWFVGFFVLPGLVAMWHLIVFKGSLSKLAAYSVDYLQYYFGLGWTGKMESTFCADPYCLMANFATATTSWPNHYGALFAGLSLLVPVAGLVLLFKKNKKPADVLFIIFAGMCAAQFIFFYFNGIHKQSRYYFIGGFIGLVGLCVFVIHFFQQYITSGRVRLVLFFGLAVGLVCSSLPLYREKGFNQFHADVRDVADFINHHEAIDEVLWLSFGPQPLPFASFYFDASKRWFSVFGFAADKLRHSGGSLQADADFYWKRNRSYYVLVEQWQDKPSSVDLCASDIFHNNRFKVLECSPTELEAIYLFISQGKMRFPKTSG